MDTKNIENRKEQIMRWAQYVKTHPKDEWREEHKQFINSQFNMHNSFVEKMLLKKNGKEILRKLFKISNKENYSKFF